MAEIYMDNLQKGKTISPTSMKKIKMLRPASNQGNENNNKLDSHLAIWQNLKYHNGEKGTALNTTGNVNCYNHIVNIH